MTELTFSKYQGTGNDFVMVLDLEDVRRIDEAAAVALCDRRFGVGADGVIRITRGADVDLVMDHRNADGSRAEMCGNGIRCLAVMAYERGVVTSRELLVGTPSGTRRVSLTLDGGGGSAVTVDMGTPAFARAAIPMDGPPEETFLSEPLQLGETSVKASAVSMGNPHLVLFWEHDLGSAPVEVIGPRLEHDERFPERTNVEFVRPHGGDLDVRVWERGVGETMACGSGACAALAAFHEAGLAGTRARARFPGGDVEVELRPDGGVDLTGNARHVFDGTVDLDIAPAARARG